jgi:integrase
VLAGIRADNFRHRPWRRITTRAELPEIALKDLRDTYASQLLTAGVQLGYVSKQLGHADVSVTAKHYAKWCGGDVYVAPIALGPHELPADVLAKLARKVPPKSHHTASGDRWSANEKPAVIH